MNTLSLSLSLFLRPPPFFLNLKTHRQNRSGFILDWKILSCIYERCTRIEMKFGSRCSGKAAGVITNPHNTLFLRQI